MRYYVVADIHSFYEPLIKALVKKGFFKENKESDDWKLVVLGDAFDRGNDSVEVAKFLLELHREDRLIYIKGNHEDLLMQCIQEISRGKVYEIASGMSNHHHNGTFDTLLQIGGMTVEDSVKFPNELVTRVRESDFYRELLLAPIDYYETKNYIFCHGWIPTIGDRYAYPPNYEYMPDWRNASTTAWTGARWLNGMLLAAKAKITEPDKTILCGHWHTSWGHCYVNEKGSEWGSDAIFTPFYADGIIALDACTAHSGIVNCIVIED